MNAGVVFALVSMSIIGSVFADRDIGSDDDWDADEVIAQGISHAVSSADADDSTAVGKYPYNEDVAEGLHDLNVASDDIDAAVRQKASDAYQRSKDMNKAYWDSLGQFKSELQQFQDSRNLTDGIRKDHVQMYNTLNLKLKDLQQHIERLRPPGDRAHIAGTPEINQSTGDSLDLMNVRRDLCPDGQLIYSDSGSNCQLIRQYSCGVFGLETYCHYGTSSVGCCCEDDVVRRTSAESRERGQAASTAFGCGQTLIRTASQDALESGNYSWGRADIQQAAWGPRDHEVTPGRFHPTLDGYEVNNQMTQEARLYCADKEIVHDLTGGHCHDTPSIGCSQIFGQDVTDYCYESSLRPCCCSKSIIDRNTQNNVFSQTKTALGCMPHAPAMWGPSSQEASMEPRTGAWDVAGTQRDSWEPGRQPAGRGPGVHTDTLEPSYSGLDDLGVNDVAVGEARLFCRDRELVHDLTGGHCQHTPALGCSQIFGRDVTDYCYESSLRPCCCSRSIIDGGTKTGIFSRTKTALGCSQQQSNSRVPGQWIPSPQPAIWGPSSQVAGMESRSRMPISEHDDSVLDRYMSDDWDGTAIDAGIRGDMRGPGRQPAVVRPGVHTAALEPSVGEARLFCRDRELVHDLTGGHCRHTPALGCSQIFGRDFADYCYESSLRPCCCSRSIIEGGTKTGIFSKTKTALGCMQQNLLA